MEGAMTTAHWLKKTPLTWIAVSSQDTDDGDLKSCDLPFLRVPAITLQTHGVPERLNTTLDEG